MRRQREIDAEPLDLSLPKDQEWKVNGSFDSGKNCDHFSPFQGGSAFHVLLANEKAKKSKIRSALNTLSVLVVTCLFFKRLFRGIFVQRGVKVPDWKRGKKRHHGSDTRAITA